MYDIESPGPLALKPTFSIIAKWLFFYLTVMESLTWPDWWGPFQPSHSNSHSSKKSTLETSEAALLSLRKELQISSQLFVVLWISDKVNINIRHPNKSNWSLLTWLTLNNLVLSHWNLSNLYMEAWKKVKMLVIQSCPTLCDPMDFSLPGSSVHWILQARILEKVASPFSRGSSWPRGQTQVFRIAGKFFTI